MNLLKMMLPIALIGCNNDNIKSNEVAFELEKECVIRPTFKFNKFVFENDTSFVRFVRPIDSINDLILRREIIPRVEADSNRIWNYKYWFNNGCLVKMEIESEWDDKPIFHDYYVINNCYWIFNLRKYHNINNDSLIQQNIFYFKDTTLLNSFVMNAFQNYIYTKTDSNKFIKKNAKGVSLNFLEKLSDLKTKH